MPEFEQNPYAAGVIAARPALSNVEQIRQDHLQHETAIKTIAIWFIVVGLVLLSQTPTVFMAARSAPFPVGLEFMRLLWPILVASIGLLHVVAGFGIRRLARWSRIPATITGLIGLLAFPIGTLLSGYFLFLLLSAKGSMIFSSDYKQVIEQTPNIKSNTSIFAWIFIGLLAVVLAIAVGRAFFSTG